MKKPCSTGWSLLQWSSEQCPGNHRRVGEEQRGQRIGENLTNQFAFEQGIYSMAEHLLSSTRP
jgi:hypothetical protein